METLPCERKTDHESGENLDFEYIKLQQTWQRVELTLKVSYVINDAIPQDCLSVHRVGRTGNGCLVQRLPFTSLVMTRISVSWEIRIKLFWILAMEQDGEFQDNGDRDRRANRERSRISLDIADRLKERKKK